MIRDEQTYDDPEWMSQVATGYPGAHGEAWNAAMWLDRKAPFFSLVEESSYQVTSYTEKHETAGTTIGDLLIEHGIIEHGIPVSVQPEMSGGGGNEMSDAVQDIAITQPQGEQQ